MHVHSGEVRRKAVRECQCVLFYKASAAERCSACRDYGACSARMCVNVRKCARVCACVCACSGQQSSVMAAAAGRLLLSRSGSRSPIGAGERGVLISLETSHIAEAVISN